MAIRTAEDTKGAVITGQVPPFMNDRYAVRVKKASAGESKSAGHNFMITLECEIVKPLSKQFSDGKVYALDSLTVNYYLMLVVNDKETGEQDMAKTKKALDSLVGVGGLHERLGLKPEIDDENPDTKVYEGLVFDAILNSKEKIAQKPDPEHPGSYKAITDSNNKPISQGWEIQAQVQNILGISSEEIPNRNY